MERERKSLRTTGSWTFAGSEDCSPNPSPGLKLSVVHDDDTQIDQRGEQFLLRRGCILLGN